MTNTPVESHTESLRDALQSRGPSGVIEYIGSLPESQRLEVYGYAQRILGPRGESDTSLDDYTAIARAGIDEALSLSSRAGDSLVAASLKDMANVASFNLLADLAECWPNDTVPRERRHFEEGLRAAEDCVRWRDELGKPPGRKALGWWGKGMHLLSLGRHDEAVDAFRTACDLVYGDAEQVATPDSTWEQLLNRGYLGIALIASGNAEGEGMYTGVRDAFETQLADESKREDAQFGLDQLAVVRGRIGGRGDVGT